MKKRRNFFFFRQTGQRICSDVAEEMKKFLTDEEKQLGTSGALFINSVDLEMINSRLLSLKDICWILEKDILANLQKVLTLYRREKFCRG